MTDFDCKNYDQLPIYLIASHNLLAVQVIFFSYACHEPQLVSHKTASSSTECSRDKPSFSFVRGQESTM